MQFTLCENTGFFLRMGLVGPSGSGKTYTALKIATELGFQKVGILDTENRSARRYARCFSRRFLALELDHFSPRDYIAGIHAAVDAGIEVLVIDSLSHAWMGKGGVLEMVDQSTRRQSRGAAASSFNGWREVTPEHNRLVEALVQAPLHLIVTMRVKTDYIVEKDAQGKSVPRKVGLAPVQRDGLEYEFDIVGDLSPEHELAVTKSRCPRLADLVMSKPGAELAVMLRTWLDGADGQVGLAGQVGQAGLAPAPAEPVAALSAAAALAPVAAGPSASAPTSAAEAAPAGTTPAAEEGMPLEGSAVAQHLEGELPRMKAVPPKPRGEGAVDEIQSISPWLQRIQAVEENGSEEQLDEVREEMNSALKKRTRMQGEVLRRAIETAKAAIRVRARQQKLFGEQPPLAAPLHSTG